MSSEATVELEVAQVLRCESVTVRFGGLVALEDVALSADAGRITGLIGPNGAGKTTLFNVMTGVQEPTRGRVFYEGNDITSWPPHRRGRAGIARTFQRLELFAGLTVHDNLLSAWEASVRGGVLGRHGSDGREVVEGVIEWLRLEDLAYRAAGELSTGQGRLVELGRTLCTNPRLLLLDEPSSGLDSAETDRFRDVLIEIVREPDGPAVLLVEHDMGLVMEVCDRITVLDFGRVISEGTPDEVRSDTAVVSAYLGGPEAELRVGQL
jgi:branched-chain amino acid transport system ATP-binding protein